MDNRENVERDQDTLTLDCTTSRKRHHLLSAASTMHATIQIPRSNIVLIWQTKPDISDANVVNITWTVRSSRHCRASRIQWPFAPLLGKKSLLALRASNRLLGGEFRRYRRYETPSAPTYLAQTDRTRSTTDSDRWTCRATS